MPVLYALCFTTLKTFFGGERLLFRGRLLFGGAYFRDSLTSVEKGAYFRGALTFEGELTFATLRYFKFAN